MKSLIKKDYLLTEIQIQVGAEEAGKVISDIFFVYFKLQFKISCSLVLGKTSKY
jgi:hypothetical protein